MSLQSDLNPVPSGSSQLVPSSVGTVQFKSVDGGRQYALLCPEFMEQFQEEMSLLASSQTIDKTVRGGMTTLWAARLNPEYVVAVNQALGKIKSAMSSPQFEGMDPRMKKLFLSRAWQWTTEIKCANALQGITDFNNRPLEALQARLKRSGASQEYLNVLNFLQSISQIAFADAGPLFRYPSYTMKEEKSMTDQNGILMRQGGDWLLVPANTGSDQKAVFDALTPIVESFKDNSEKGIRATITEQELLYGIALIGQVMTNYLACIDEAPPVSHQVFRKLLELHELMFGLLSDKEGLSITLNHEGKRELQDTLAILSNVLSKPQFNNFYCRSQSTDLLKDVEPFIGPFITFHLSPELIHHKHGWINICSDEKSGVHVFKNKDNELVVIFNGHNEFWERQKFNAFAFIGGRGTEFELDGMVHQQALDNASKGRKALLNIMQARRPEIGEFSKIKFIGYGLDGATAQLIGQDYKRTERDKDVTVIGCGVPAFLDEAASASMGLAMKKMPGFNCLNFTMAGDSNIRNLGITSPLGMRYDNTAFTTFPVPQGTVFASEAVKGDSRKAYMQMLKMSLFMHQSMRKVFERTETAYTLVEKVNPISEPQASLESGDQLQIEQSYIVVGDDDA